MSAATRVIPAWQVEVCDKAGVNPEEYIVCEVDARWRLDFNRDGAGQQIPGTVVVMTETIIPIKAFKNQLLNENGVFQVLDELGAFLPFHEVVFTCDKKLWRESFVASDSNVVDKEGLVPLRWALLEGPDKKVVPGVVAAVGVFPIPVEQLRHRTLAPDGFPAGLRSAIKAIKGRVFIHRDVLAPVEPVEGEGADVPPGLIETLENLQGEAS